ncbi:hypothetical protein AB0H73_38555 [Streptomyces olivoreticuli]
MPARTALSYDTALRVVDYGLADAPVLYSAHRSQSPSAFPPLRPEHLRAIYHSRDGQAWRVESVHFRGTYACGPQSRYHGLTAAPESFYPGSPVDRDGLKPGWVVSLIDVLRIAGAQTAVAGGPVGMTVTADRAERKRGLVIEGTDEIPPQYPVEWPLRPDLARLAYVSSGGGAWELDCVEFQGPYVAPGTEPGPDHKQGRTAFYPRSTDPARQTPKWVRDFVREHQSPAPLAPYQTY